MPCPFDHSVTGVWGSGFTTFCMTFVQLLHLCTTFVQPSQSIKGGMTEDSFYLFYFCSKRWFGLFILFPSHFLQLGDFSIWGQKKSTAFYSIHFILFIQFISFIPFIVYAVHSRSILDPRSPPKASQTASGPGSAGTRFGRRMIGNIRFHTSFRTASATPRRDSML